MKYDACARNFFFFFFLNYYIRPILGYFNPQEKKKKKNQLQACPISPTQVDRSLKVASVHCLAVLGDHKS